METSYHGGVVYDIANTRWTGDIDFYVNQASKTGNPVLELGCGTGRITIPVAKAGVEITGLDLEESMLAQARKKAVAAGVNVQWILADATSFNIGRTFQSILAPYDALQGFCQEVEQIGSFFRSVHAHLRTGGVLIFDVLNPQKNYLSSRPSFPVPPIQYLDPDLAETVTMTTECVYADCRQLLHYTFRFSTPQRSKLSVTRVTHRVFFPEELDQLVTGAGFRIIEKHGDFNGGPFSSDCFKQVIIAAAS
jgi:2-polyprenyl-3-methyl-5-hydroxy-6-metoxy-1,4-benzoquinol methylase